MMLGVAFFSTTSWLPPSTMEVEETIEDAIEDPEEVLDEA